MKSFFNTITVIIIFIYIFIVILTYTLLAKIKKNIFEIERKEIENISLIISVKKFCNIIYLFF